MAASSAASRISDGLSLSGTKMSTPPWPTTMRVTSSAASPSSTSATRSVVGALDRHGAATICRPWPHLVHAGPVENRDVVRAFGGEQRAGVHRRRVERIVVAGQQVHRNADGAHGFQRLADVTRGELVVLEDVARHDDELGAVLRRPALRGPRRRHAGRPNTAAAPRRSESSGSCRVASRRCARIASRPVPFCSLSLAGQGECRSGRRQVPGRALGMPYG